MLTKFIAWLNRKTEEYLVLHTPDRDYYEVVCAERDLALIKMEKFHHQMIQMDAEIEHLNQIIEQMDDEADIYRIELNAQEKAEYAVKQAVKKLLDDVQSTGATEEVDPMEVAEREYNNRPCFFDEEEKVDIVKCEKCGITHWSGGKKGMDVFDREKLTPCNCGSHDFALYISPNTIHEKVVIVHA